MNYINYFIDGGGIPTKTLKSDNKLINVKGYLVRDDFDKLYENIRNYFNQSKKNTNLSTENTSSNITRSENNITNSSNILPYSNNNYYLWINKDANNKYTPSYILFLP